MYREISRGKLIVRALASISAAGLGADGLPKLAIARADSEWCHLSLWGDGSARFCTERWVDGRTAASKRFHFPAGTFAPGKMRDAAAMVPHIPPDIRPRRGLENYHILFEPDWKQMPPVDPILLRRIGKGDAWLVCGAWDLTEVERAAMQTHVGRPQ